MESRWWEDRGWVDRVMQANNESTQPTKTFGGWTFYLDQPTQVIQWNNMYYHFNKEQFTDLMLDKYLVLPEWNIIHDAYFEKYNVDLPKEVFNELQVQAGRGWRLARRPPIEACIEGIPVTRPILNHIVYMHSHQKLSLEQQLTFFTLTHAKHLEEHKVDVAKIWSEGRFARFVVGVLQLHEWVINPKGKRPMNSWLTQRAPQPWSVEEYEKYATWHKEVQFKGTCHFGTIPVYRKWPHRPWDPDEEKPEQIPRKFKGIQSGVMIAGERPFPFVTTNVPFPFFAGRWS